MHEAPRLLDVARLGHHVEVRFVVEQHAQPATHDRVIVGNDDPDPGRCRFGHAHNATGPDT